MSACEGRAMVVSGAAAAAPARGYTGPMRAMHWATVAPLLGAYAAAWAIGDAATPAQAAWLLMLHRSFGLAVLALTALRFAWRRRTAVPPLPSDTPPAQRFAARASVVALYALMAIQPVLGLTGSLLYGDRVTVFGGAVLPAVLPVDRPLAGRVFEAHGWAALLLLALVGLHVMAALHHHLVRGDEVMVGMLPVLRSLPRPARLEPEKMSR